MGSRPSSKDSSQDPSQKLRIGSKDSSHTGSKRARILSEVDECNSESDANLPGVVDAESGTCRVCMELLIDTELQPCGHRLACQLCAKQLRGCPMCRQQILISVLSDLL